MKALISDFGNDSGLLSMVGTRCRRVRTARRAVPTSKICASENKPSIPDVSVAWQAAFTLIELLVVIATLAILAVMLLPALAGTQAQSKTTACTARFRQWAVSVNLYANDNRGWLPTANPAGGGALAWDVGTHLPDMLYRYGVDIPDWFCPMQPQALDGANVWAQAQLAHPIQIITNLIAYWSRQYPNECALQGCCNYWVPRYNASGTPPPGIQPFPPDYSRLAFPPAFIVAGKPTCLNYGWPLRLHDIAVPYVPFVSDSAGSGQSGGLASPVVSTNVSTISKNTAHFVNDTLIGVNCSYADGHVEAHNPSQMRAAYNNGTSFWFY
jgi:prepilin-type N-terminal cleavage/methylation domain-containing protein/prepilin-type processing-associated H-X9-DG protein